MIEVGNCVVNNIYENFDVFENRYWTIIMTTPQGDKIRSNYGGSRKLPEENEIVNVRAKVKAHREYNGISTTIVNYIKFK